MKDHCLHDLKCMVDDISLSCASSIDILNDLLVYDQVEEGHLILKQRHVKIIDCLQKISKPFQLQATDAGIHFTFIGSSRSTNLLEGNGSEGTSGNRNGNAEEEIESDSDSDGIGDIVVCIDTFKMAQVIRNLLSNAFKHTSQGGFVRVNVRVINRDDTPAAVKNTPLSLSKSHLVFLLLKENNSFVRIEIKDSGSGVSLVRVSSFSCYPHLPQQGKPIQTLLFHRFFPHGYCGEHSRRLWPWSLQ
jgi:signal transduction histidine kinase